MSKVHFTGFIKNGRNTFTGFDGRYIKHSTKMKPQYIYYSVLQAKVKFVIEAPPLLGS